MNPMNALGATIRHVATRDHEGKPAHVVVATRTYATDAADLWDALTNPERLPRWFLPVSGDLRPGGRYKLTGNAEGTITTCEPPRTLGLTWEFGGQVSWVTVRLRADSPGRTELQLEHIAHPDAHWEKFGPGATGVGWDLALMGLGEHLSGAPAVEPSNAMAWMTSEAGKAFMRQSSTAWAEAAIASGTPEADARAAEAQTTAAYTGA